MLHSEVVCSSQRQETGWVGGELCNQARIHWEGHQRPVVPAGSKTPLVRVPEEIRWPLAWAGTLRIGLQEAGGINRLSHATASCQEMRHKLGRGQAATCFQGPPPFRLTRRPWIGGIYTVRLVHVGLIREGWAGQGCPNRNVSSESWLLHVRQRSNWIMWGITKKQEQSFEEIKTTMGII